jgi:hypothetical protein
LNKSLFDLNKPNNDFYVRYGVWFPNTHILASRNVGVAKFTDGCCETQRGVLQLKKGVLAYAGYMERTVPYKKI